MPTMKSVYARFGGPSSLVLSVLLTWILISVGPSGHAQGSIPQLDQATEVLQAPTPVIPQQVRYIGKLASRAGQTVDVVFRIYAVPQEGEPLWTETQRIVVADDGSYSVLLGSSDPGGLPQTVFAAGAARWLGVSVERSPELDRVMLASVPYAMKSADAEALAGHRAADFVTQDQLAQFEAQRVPAPAPAVAPNTAGTVTGSGAAGVIPMWTGALTQGDSNMVRVGPDIGINVANPGAALDVGGTGMIRGTLSLPALSTATTSGGERSQALLLGASAWSTTANAAVNPIFQLFTVPVANNTASPSASLVFRYQVMGTSPANVLTVAGDGALTSNGGLTVTPLSPATQSAAVNSPPVEMSASAWSSGSSRAVEQNFAWEAIATGNDTTAPSGNLALLYSSSKKAPASTGLSISPNGIIHWAPGQTFPFGAITSVTAGTDLTGGGDTGNITLNVDTTKVVTGVTAGKGLTGGGTGGTPSLALDTTRVPLLIANNVFSGSNRFQNEIAASSSSSAAGSFNGGGKGAQGQAGVIGSGGSSAISGVKVGGPAFSGTGGAGVGSYGNPGGGDGIDATGGTTTASSSLAGNGGSFTGGAVGPGIYGGDGVYAYGGKGEQGGYGISATGGDAVPGCSNLCIAGAGGVFNGGGGVATGGGDGVLAYAGGQGGTGVVGVGCAGYSDSPNCVYAGEFLGDVDVNGNVTKSGGSFKIDDPIDPANKYLYHSFVESPDMKNIYDGNVVTDGEGLAKVTLPDWFEALNSDFRYQLTVIGQFAQAIVSSEISNNAFVIRTDKPNVKVSWQVTGIRHDAWAKAHRIPVEVPKAKGDQGHYLHPELFDHKGEPSIAALHHPRPTRQVATTTTHP